MTVISSLRHDKPGAQVGQAYHAIELPTGHILQIKMEGYRTDASIKEKPAREMFAGGLEQGLIDPKIGIIETSSGNTARALARIGAVYGIPVTLVVDPNVTKSNVDVMEAFGARVIHVTERDPGGGFQISRIARVKAECQESPGLYWVNQYDNPGNALSHMKTTGPEIQTAWPNVPRVYCAVGTGGTATGLGRYFGVMSPGTEVIGCDVIGSVTFGGRPGPRYISGPGNSFVPGNWEGAAVAEKVYVPEPEAVAVCHWLAERHGLLLGGSTGLTIAGVLRHLKGAPVLKAGTDLIAISADTGEKYLDHIWNDSWIERHYGRSRVIDAAKRLELERPTL